MSKVKWKLDISLNKYFWGVVLLCIAAAIIIDALDITPGFLGELSIWSILLIIVMAGWIISSLFKLEMGSIVIPIAVIFMMTRKLIANAVGIESIAEVSIGTVILFTFAFLVVSNMMKGVLGKIIIIFAFAVVMLKSWIAQLIGVPALADMSNWLILACSILIAWGIDLLIPINGKKTYEKHTEGSSTIGTKIRYIDCTDLTEAYSMNHLGDYAIYFQNIEHYKGDATLTVENKLGNMNIYVPDTWYIDCKVNNSLGECKVQKGNDGGKVLHINGENKLGTLKVHTQHYNDSEAFEIGNAEETYDSISKYINCENFTDETIKCDRSEYEVFFSNIDEYCGNATLHIENKVGAIKVNVPRGWRVNTDIANSVGVCNCDCDPSGDGPLLNIVGENKVGAINIDYYDYD